MKVKLSSAVAVAAAMFCSASYASAATYGTVNAKYTGVDGVTMKVALSGASNYNNYNSNGTLKTSGLVTQNMNVWGGKMNWSTLGGPGWSPSGSGAPVGNPSNFSTYCIDLVETVTTNLSTYYINSLGDAPNPGRQPNPIGMGAVTWAGSATVKKDRIISELFGDVFSTLATNADYAAFQIAIWKIIYETDTGSTSGVKNALKLNKGNVTFTNFGNLPVGTTSASLTAKAEGYLSNLSLGLSTTGLFGLTSPDENSTAGGKQDQVYYVPPSAPGPVPLIPLPAASVAGLAIMGMIGAKRALRN